MKRTVAIIIERSDIALGGAERSIFELSSALSELGLKVDILAAKGQTNADNIYILCRNYPGRRTSHCVFAKELKKHLSQHRYDIVHSVLPFDFVDIYQPRGGSYTEAVLRNAASYENKFTEFYKKLTAFANFRRTALLHAEKKLCKNPNGPIVAALSQYVAQQFKQYYHLDDSRIVVIPNGVKINKQTGSAETESLRSKILSQLNINPYAKPVFFLFAANNFRLKGLPCLLKAMQLATVNNNSRPLYLVVVGDDASLKYRHMAKKCNVHNRIVFLGKVRNIQDVLSISDIAVLPTFYDPSSRFILEALAAEKPVITTKFNGAADLFTAGLHGIVIDSPQNITALADALDYFTNTDNIKKASRAIASDNLKEKISITRAAQQLITLYDRIIHGRQL
jgi:UDP-glucose:(heptosyl)LPS alpha-1,3-glucosyltransferase